MGKTAIIILNYNNPADTINCIDSVERFNTAPVKYVIVDNGSTAPGVVFDIDNFLCGRFGENYRCLSEGDPEPESLPYVTFFVSKTNDGYARGNNKGISLVENDPEIERLLILNNDILFIEDIIPGLCKAQDVLPRCAIISPLLLVRNGVDVDWNCARKDTPVSAWIKNNFLTPVHSLFKKDLYDIYEDFLILYNMRKPYPEFIPIELPSGACMLIKKNLFREIGYFDEGTFLYYEENILYRKILKLGLQSYISTHLRVIHLGAATMVKSPSKFIWKAAKASRSYYVETYLKAPLHQRLLLHISDIWVELFMLFKGLVKRN